MADKAVLRGEGSAGLVESCRVAAGGEFREPLGHLRKIARLGTLPASGNVDHPPLQQWQPLPGFE